MSETIKTPDSLVDLDGLFSSTVKGFEKYGILYKIEYSTSRSVSGDVSGNLDSRAEVRATPVKIWIKSGTYDPTIEQHMNEGKPFQKLEVITLTNANGANQVKQTVTFYSVMITEVTPNMTVTYNGADVSGLVCVELRYGARTNQVAEFGQDGTKKGQNVAGWNYGKACPF
jgi:hypothetical protein